MSRRYKSPEEVPNDVLAARLRELADFITKPSKREDERLPSEFYMRIPAEVDHDADIVMAEAARRLTAPAPVAPGGVITEVVADLRSILLIEPDTEDEDDLLAEYRDCLATAKRLAKHALSAALSPGGKVGNQR